MKSVRIADLKARLSEHLRGVRRGQSVVVLDRDTPIARIVPYEAEAVELSIREPARRVRPGRVRFPPPLKTRVDVVELLLQERQTGR